MIWCAAPLTSRMRSRWCPSHGRSCGAWLFLHECLSMQACGQGSAAVRHLIDSYGMLGDRATPQALRHLQVLSFIYYMEGEDLDLLKETAQKLTEESESEGPDLSAELGPSDARPRPIPAQRTRRCPARPSRGLLDLQIYGQPGSTRVRNDPNWHSSCRAWVKSVRSRTAGVAPPARPGPIRTGER